MSSSPAQPIKTRQTNVPWYREPWPWLLMAGPFAVLVAGALTGYLAFTSNDGLVADDYYKEGLTINRTIKRRDAALVAGLTGKLNHSGGKLELRLASNSALVMPPAIQLHITHPTRAAEDLLVNLSRLPAAEKSDNRYVGTIDESRLTHTPNWKLSLETPDWRLQGRLSSGQASAELIP